MRRKLTFQASAEDSGMTVAAFLRGKGCSRHVLAHLKNTEQDICRNGEKTYLSQRLKPQDKVTLTIVEDVSSENIIPVPMKLDIVYEDEDILVVNKPADMPIHPSINNFDNTLANGLADYYQKKGEAFVYRCITRLDRDTTGLLVIAKHMLSAAVLSEAGRRREIRREYLAIADGYTPEEGVIDAPIARREGSVLERCVDFERGEHAVTHYRTLEQKCGYSLIKLKLETGRTHQIRVHMKYLGYPLIGDFLYHPDYRLLPHQALHSCRLSFAHPITGEQMDFSAEPPWQGVWSKLEKEVTV